MVAVSIVIPVWNAGATLGETLDALLAMRSQAVEVEIIVSDDGSDDASVQIATSRPDVRVVRGPHAGPSAARNRGAAAASGEVLVFLDGDDRPLLGWLDQIIEGFANSVVGMLTWPAEVTASGAESIEIWYPNRDGPDGVLALAGCFALRRRVFDAIGRYDEQLRMGENTDLCDRARVWCDQHGLDIVRLSAVTIRIAFGQPSEHYDRHRLEAMEYLLERDADHYRASPPDRAKAHAIAAVNAARCEEWGRARGHAWSSVRAAPVEPNAYVRLLLAWLPPLARHRWSAATRRTRLAGPRGRPSSA